MDPLIITVAPNGARKTTDDHPALPVTPQTISETAKQCADAGAAMVHMHIRDGQQGHTLDAGIYKEATAEVRKQAGDDIIVQITTEEVGIYTPQQQMQVVRDVQPEAVSIAMREFLRDGVDEGDFQRFLAEVSEMQIMPQYILYSPQEVQRFAELRKAKVIPGEQISLLFVLGRKQGSPEKAADPAASWAQPEDLDPFLECFDGALKLAETHWAICAFGGNELACAQYAAKCGGHVRIGFENNQLLADGSVAPNNAALISQFAESATRPLASANAARELFTKGR